MSKIEKPSILSLTSTDDLVWMLGDAERQHSRWKHVIRKAKQAIDNGKWERAHWKAQAQAIRAEIAKRDTEEGWTA